MEMKKITVSVNFNTEKIVATLMKKIGWKEIERVATGGMMSNEVLLITYEGYDTDYKEDYYVEVKSPTNIEYSTFYSLRVLNGHYTNDFTKFKQVHEKAKVEYECKLITERS
jgi:hypothetical protein